MIIVAQVVLGVGTLVGGGLIGLGKGVGRRVRAGVMLGLRRRLRVLLRVTLRVVMLRVLMDNARRPRMV